MAEAERGFLGLTHNPFVQPDEGFFEQADRKTHLEQLRHLSQWSRRVLLVTGPAGMGKSMLYRQLSATLEPRCKAARIHGSLINASREVLVSVAQGFGIAAPSEANSQLLTSLIERHVDEQSAAERICVVMVDDADLLEPKAVVDLMSLAQACSLQLVLFGEVKLVPAIERAAGRLGLGWHEIRLTGFSEQQTREYLEWRFQQARYRGRLPFTESQVQEIQRLSDGLPGKINQLANVLLVKLETGDIGRSGSVFPAVHRALLVLLLVVVGLVYLLWLQGEDADEQDRIVLEEAVPIRPVGAEALTGESAAPVVAQTERRAKPLADKPQFGMASDPRQSPGSTIASQPADGIPFGQQPEIPEQTEGRAGELEETIAPGETLDPAPGRGTVDTPIEQPMELQPLQPQSVPQAQTDPTSAFAEVGAAPAEVASAQSDQQTEPVVATAPPVDDQRSAVDEDERTAAPAPVSTADASSEDNTSVGIRGAEWLLAQQGEQFTLQLVTVSSAERAQTFIDKQGNPQQFASYELERDGRRLHVVVFGLFDSRADAETASRSLPASVGNVQPWIRTLEQVHGAIYTVR